MNKTLAARAMQFMQNVRLTGAEVNDYNLVVIALAQEIKDGKGEPTDRSAGRKVTPIGDKKEPA